MKDQVLIGDCKDVLTQFPDETFDCIVTDPPYGYSFMGLSWDKALPSLNTLKECCRVLKAGAFGFFMCAPRQDVLSRMIIRLEDAGFNVNFSSVYHCYSSGFPKSSNVCTLIHKRNGTPSPMSDDTKQFNGAFAGNQLKPAVECIIICMKSLSEKTYLDQALANGHGCTWLGDCRIPYTSDVDKESARWGTTHDITGGNFGANGACKPRGEPHGKNVLSSGDGRFPANLLVSDDVLNDGIIHKSGDIKPEYNYSGSKTSNVYGERARNTETFKANSGSFSRYFDLDAWFAAKLPEQAQKTYPCLIVSKPSNSEKNKYIENKHPTVKPLKLMSYLITMGSREGDLILDPFAGSGTTLEACKRLNREFVGIDKDDTNKPLMEARGQLNKVTLETFQEAKI